MSTLNTEDPLNTPTADPLKTLTCNIQREWLARILGGSKRIEYRDASAYWYNRLAKVGEAPFQIRFINGMRPGSPEATVLVESVDVDILGVVIRFHLGPVISALRCDPRWQQQFPPSPPDPPFDPGSIDPFSIKRTKIVLKVSEELIRKLHAPGQHQFKLPVNVNLHMRLERAGPDPFLLSVASRTTSTVAILYEAYWDIANDIYTFSVITDHERLAVPALS